NGIKFSIWSVGSPPPIVMYLLLGSHFSFIISANSIGSQLYSALLLSHVMLLKQPLHGLPCIALSQPNKNTSILSLLFGLGPAVFVHHFISNILSPSSGFNSLILIPPNI